MFDGFFRDFSDLGNIATAAIMRIIPALICITFHELAHGFTAYKLGDRTAKDMGRLTLNPIKHIDIFGLLMMMIFRFGWAKPVPVDMRNFKYPKRYMAVTAIAGPLSNIFLAAVVFFIYGLVIVPLTSMQSGEIVKEMIETTIYLSIALAVFNLMPIPPLDGSKVVFSLLSEENYYKLMRYERYGILVLILVLNTGFFRSTIGQLTNTLFYNLIVFFQFAFNLANM
jgi:Zn-dependent protease